MLVYQCGIDNAGLRKGLGRINAMLPVPVIVSDFLISKATATGLSTVHLYEKRPDFIFLVGGYQVKRLELGYSILRKTL